MTERRHMANAEKVAAVAELTERFRGSSGAVLTEYRGLTVAQLAELRRSLGGHATFAVVKNTLTKIAVNEAGLDEQLSSLLAGAAATFNALPVQLAQLAEALRVKRAEAEGGAPEASAPEASAPEASAPEASAPEADAAEASAAEAGTPDAQAAAGDGDEG